MSTPLGTRSCPAGRYYAGLTTIPGIGPITAATIQALVPDPAPSRQFGTSPLDWVDAEDAFEWGGKERLGKISKMGNRRCVSLLVLGAQQCCGIARRGAPISHWLTALLSRRPAKVAAIALATRWPGSFGLCLLKRVRSPERTGCRICGCLNTKNGLTNWAA